MSVPVAPWLWRLQHSMAHQFSTGSHLFTNPVISKIQHFLGLLHHGSVFKLILKPMPVQLECLGNLKTTIFCNQQSSEGQKSNSGRHLTGIYGSNFPRKDIFLCFSPHTYMINSPFMVVPSVIQLAHIFYRYWQRILPSFPSYSSMKLFLYLPKNGLLIGYRCWIANLVE